MKVFYLIILVLLSFKIFCQKEDTLTNSTFYPFEQLNLDSLFIKKNHIKKITDVDYKIKNNKYKYRKELAAKVYSQLGMIVEDYNIDIEYRGGPHKTTYQYNSKNELVQVKEFYPNNRMQISLIDFEELKSKQKSMVYNRRFWKGYRDTIYDSKKQIIEIHDTSYKNQGVKDVYEHDSLNRITREIRYEKHSDEKTNLSTETIENIIEYVYFKNGYQKIEKYFYDEIKDKFYYINPSSKPFFYSELIYVDGFSSPTEEIIYNPKTGKPKSSNKKEFEYYDK